MNLRPGDPWVFLDLSDGTSLPALGIQPGIAKQRAIERRAHPAGARRGPVRGCPRARSGLTRAVHPAAQAHVLINLLAEALSCASATDVPPGLQRAPCYPRSDSLQRWTDRPVVPAPPPPDISRRRHHDHPPAAPCGGIPADPRQRLLRGRRVRPRHGRAAGRREGRRRGRPTGPYGRRRRSRSCPSSSPAPSSASPSPRSSSACSPSRRSRSCCTARSPRSACPKGPSRASR